MDGRCSNSLLEAHACGLPALYVDGGSNREVVDGSLALVARSGELQAAIRILSLAETADRYLEVLRP